MLDLIGTIGITGATVVTITAVLSTLRAEPRIRLSVAALLGVWIVLQLWVLPKFGIQT